MVKRDILPTIPRRRKSLEPVSNDDDETEHGSNNGVLSPKKKRTQHTIQNDDINDDDDFSYFSSQQEEDRQLQHSANQSRFDSLFGCATTVDSMILNSSTFTAARPTAGQTTNDMLSQQNTGMLAIFYFGASRRRTTSHLSWKSVGQNSRPSLSTINEFQRKICFDEDESNKYLSSNSWHTRCWN
jgi:hypothetical protein